LELGTNRPGPVCVKRRTGDGDVSPRNHSVLPAVRRPLHRNRPEAFGSRGQSRPVFCEKCSHRSGRGDPRGDEGLARRWQVPFGYFQNSCAEFVQISHGLGSSAGSRRTCSAVIASWHGRHSKVCISGNPLIGGTMRERCIGAPQLGQIVS
jgi:hypothetical protein